MKRLAICAGVLLAFGSLTFSLAKPVDARTNHAARHLTLPKFQFRSYTAGETVPDEVVEPCRQARNERDNSVHMEALYLKHPELRPDPNDPFVSCFNEADNVGGVDVQSQVSFYHDQLSSVNLRFKPIGFSALADAFRAKYGTPCKSGVEVLETLGGGHVRSPFYRWCFATGTLTIKMYYYDLEVANASYDDQNQPPPRKPTVNF